MSVRWIGVTLLIWHTYLVAGRLHAGDDNELLFVRRVRPLLQEKCLPCHGSDAAERKGGLDLSAREAALQGGDSQQPAIEPGAPENSPLYLSVTRTHSDWAAMPPKDADRLRADQLAWLKAWISGGASWPNAERVAEIMKAHGPQWTQEDGVLVQTEAGLTPDWSNRRYRPQDLWGYQSVAKPSLSTAGGDEAHPVDALLAQRFPEGITPAAPASAEVLIRRATFDLTGLPPSPDEVSDFVAASRRNQETAMKQLIDRLLASPHYGERLAQHWLDITRYADSSGFANDYERGNAWRYRDYVVRSFNADKSYDQFIREQIAGDELRPDDPEMLVAVGFLRMGPWELTGMEVAKVARQRFLDDVTNSVGEVFLAHSLQCARCHDHKFDPVPTQDYYAIQACFSSTQLAERPAPFVPTENTNGFDERKFLEVRRQEHLRTLEELDARLLANAQTWFAESGRDPTAWNDAVAAARTLKDEGKGPPGRRSFAGIFELARGSMQKKKVSEDEYPPKLVGFSAQEFGQERVARKGLERLAWELERYEPIALSVYSGRTPSVNSVTAPLRVPADRFTQGELEQTAILAGGDPFSPLRPVKPGALSALGKQEFPETIEGKRTALANWIADAKNPLTTRTIANRLWMWHFGQPLAGNPNNFGSTGKKPTHPELLDWLAATLVESGWSFKAMHRTIMTSAAYRRSCSPSMSAAQLPREQAEQMYLVFRPRRLSAEELRDAMLSATGELNRSLGGIPNRPEINLEAALQPRMVMGTFAAAWTPNPLPHQRHRRSLYALKLRGLADPSLEVFNAPSPDFSCEMRESSIVTPQAFSLFNSQPSYSRALALADRVLREGHRDGEAVRRCLSLACGRSPGPDEIQFCLNHWREMEAIQSEFVPVARQVPREIRREAVEENTGEKFTFLETLPAYSEFVPDLGPADCDARTRALADVCLVLFNSNEFAYVY